MKNVLLIALGLLFATEMAASPEFQQRKHNLGLLKKPWQAEVVYEFRNTGDKLLVVQNVTTDCGCTVAEYTRKPVKPGRKGRIRIRFDGKGIPPGYFHRTITVATSDWKIPVVRLYLEGIRGE